MEVSKSFEILFEGIMNSINTAMLCTVLSFDEENCTAKIKPLFKMLDAQTRESLIIQPIEDVPVVFQNYKLRGQLNEVYETIPYLQPGDIVQVIFNQYAIDDALEGKVTVPSFSQRFSTHDAVIIGILKTQN